MRQRPEGVDPGDARDHDGQSQRQPGVFEQQGECEGKCRQRADGVEGGGRGKARPLAGAQAVRRLRRSPEACGQHHGERGETRRDDEALDLAIDDGEDRQWHDDGGRSEGEHHPGLALAAPDAEHRRTDTEEQREGEPRPGQARQGRREFRRHAQGIGKARRLHADSPAEKDEEREEARCRNGGGHRRGPPGERHDADRQNPEERDGGQLPLALGHRQHGETSEGAEDHRRHHVAAALTHLGEANAGHDEDGGRHDAGERLHEARIGAAGGRDQRQRPEDDRDSRCGETQPVPVADPGEGEAGRGDDRRIDREDIGVRVLGGDQEGRREGCDEADGAEQRAVQAGENQRAETDGSQRHEGEGRADEAIERMGGIDRAEGRDGARTGEGRGNVSERQGRQALVAAAQPFAAGKQRQGEQETKRDAHPGPDEPLLDGVAHEENAAETEGDGADPDRPARADALLEAADIGGRRRRRRRCRSIHRIDGLQRSRTGDRRNRPADHHGLR